MDRRTVDDRLTNLERPNDSARWCILDLDCLFIRACGETLAIRRVQHWRWCFHYIDHIIEKWLCSLSLSRRVESVINRVDGLVSSKEEWSVELSLACEALDWGGVWCKRTKRCAFWNNSIGTSNWWFSASMSVHVQWFIKILTHLLSFEILRCHDSLQHGVLQNGIEACRPGQRGKIQSMENAEAPRSFARGALSDIYGAVTRC